MQIDDHVVARAGAQLRGFRYTTYATVPGLPASGQPGEIVYVTATGQDYQWNPVTNRWVPLGNQSYTTVPITGDGATTVFTVVHNLGFSSPFIPLSVSVLDPSGALLSASSYQIGTLAANSFVVTFGVAPASGATHQFKITSEVAAASSGASGSTGSVQLSDGAGALTSNAGLVLTGSTLTAPSVTTTAAITYTGVISPAALAADTNDWAPAGFATAAIVRVSATSPFTAITGLAGGAAGRTVYLTNVGTVPVLLRAQSTSSAAANRFGLSADQRVEAGSTLTLTYDGSASRWTSADPLTGHPADPTTPWVIVDDFLSGGTTSGTVGEYGWSFSLGSVAAAPAASNTPGSITRTSSAVAAQIAYMTAQASAFTTSFSFGELASFHWRAAMTATTADFTVRFGVCSGAFADPPTDGVWFERLAADTSWFGVTRSAGVQTRTAALVAQDTAFHNFRCRALTATTVGFQIDRGAEVTVATNIPGSALGSMIFHQIIPSAAAARSHTLDFVSVAGTANSSRW